MKRKNIYETPSLEEIDIASGYRFCESSPENGAIEDVGYDDWTI